MKIFAKNGYRPWVAKEAPLFNTALNASYIKVNALLPIIIISLAIGAGLPTLVKRTGAQKQIEITKIKPYVSNIAATKKPTPSIIVNPQPSDTPRVPAIVPTSIPTTFVSPTLPAPVMTPNVAPTVIVPSIPMGMNNPSSLKK